MKITILTLFPHLFDGFLTESIIKRAIDKKKVEVEIIDFREFSTKSNKQVDDTPYGGGAGMVLMCQPIYDAIKSVKTDDSLVIMLTPGGEIYNQKLAKDLTSKKHIILLCGHYEGFDERIKNFVDMEVSIGEFVLTGGEIPAMVISDSIIRLLEGVINKDSLESESYDTEYLDYPVYTKPASFMGLDVPEVLISGDHKKIDEWRINNRKKN